MSKLPVISGLDAVKAFSRHGFTKVRQTGSHVPSSTPQIIHPFSLLLSADELASAEIYFPISWGLA